jgi:hypothetical protein
VKRCHFVSEIFKFASEVEPPGGGRDEPFSRALELWAVQRMSNNWWWVSPELLIKKGKWTQQCQPQLSLLLCNNLNLAYNNYIFWPFTFLKFIGRHHELNEHFK